MISTLHSANIVECVNKRTKKKSMKPIRIREYNKFMKGVDRADQYLSYYSILRKTKKWIKKNGFIPYKLRIIQRVPDLHKKFRKSY